MTTTPYEEGTPDRKLLVLGQAPARNEIRRKQPLVGPSGEVFRDCLHSVGIARRECYILNVWEDEVTTAKNGSIYSVAGGPALWEKRGFTPYGLEMAGPTMERIRRSSANCILALGQQALELCTNKPKDIMKWRGSILQGLDRVGGKKVIATVHPAATIHGVYLWRYLIMSDMKKAREESLTPELNLPVRNIHIIQPNRPDDFIDYCAYCRREGRFASDIEVINHQVSCFSMAASKDEGVVLPLTWDEGDYWDEETEERLWLAYANVMHDPEIMKINQNIAGFDAVFLMQQNRILTRGRLGDTQIAMRILYPEFNRGLAFIASMLTREPYWKDDGKMWKNEGGDFHQFWIYNGKDSCVALESWDVLAEELTARDMWHTYDMSIQGYLPLLYMSLDGLRVDKERLEATKIEIQNEIDVRLAEFHTVADYEFNPNSSAQCAKYFYSHKGLTPYKNANGGVTTDDNAMSRIFRKTGWREAKLVQEIRNLRKLKSTYLDVVPDEDGRIRSSWDPTGTWTGRLSSSKTIFGTGMNLQNLDPRFKKFIMEDVHV